MTDLNTARSTLIAAILSLGTVEQTAPVIGALMAYLEALAVQSDRSNGS